MFNSVFCVILCFIGLLHRANGQTYDEKYRLQLHYSEPYGWMNDPNGLIYAGGVYHLFYQYNPMDTKTGQISWGHAISKDLIHWENLPIAIDSSPDRFIFSGCAIIDKKNLTGLASYNKDPMLAFYTLMTDKQQQALAYSYDNGLTFKQYDGNPIIPNPGIADFRDPNIIKRGNKYYMLLAVHDRLQFFRSKNLLHWKYLSDFGVDQGDHSGVWECPSMLTLKDDCGKKHDVVFVSMTGERRTGVFQYFVGKFNGTTLNTYNKLTLRADNGWDNYAAIPYHNDPHGRKILIGWMSNWLYAQQTPTTTWRSQMTIPRELALKHVNGVLHLIQKPVPLCKLVDRSRIWLQKKPIKVIGQTTFDLSAQMGFKTGSMMTLKYTIDIKQAKNGKVGFQFGNDQGEFVSFYYYIKERYYAVNRAQSGDTSFSSKFADTEARATRIDTSHLLTGYIILDVASIEIFADEGLNTFSAIFFPSTPYNNVEMVIAPEDSSSTVVVKKVCVSALKSIWRK